MMQREIFGIVLFGYGVKISASKFEGCNRFDIDTWGGGYRNPTLTVWAFSYAINFILYVRDEG